MGLEAAVGRIMAVRVRFAKDHSHQEYASDCYRNIKFDFGVGRTKRSAVPAIARHLRERRCASSGLQIQRADTTNLGRKWFS